MLDKLDEFTKDEIAKALNVDINEFLKISE